MSKRVWDLFMDGKCEDDSVFRIDVGDWGDYAEFLDPLMVGLAVATKHVDAKITLSRRLIEIHEEHLVAREEAGHSNLGALLPEKILDRLVYGMIAHCGEDAPTPNVLLHLLALRLCVPEKPRKGVRLKAAHRDLINLVAKNPEIGKKKAAKAVGVSPNTAKRWMDDPGFKEVVATIQRRGI